jgi:bis(5'-nucleosyl)-tetraphosphatase (symmetrical)
MSIYAIGDIQGCYKTLIELLKRVSFDSSKDRIWLVGDAINRGPNSIDVLKWARDLGDRCTYVLGNHELHCIAVARLKRPRGAKDTFGDILDSPERDDWIAWLRSKPFLHVENGHVLVHAGIFPPWNIEEAIQHNAFISAMLKGDDCDAFLDAYYAKDNTRLEPNASPERRAGFIAQAFTRMRTLSNRGTELNPSFDGPYGEIPLGSVAWFDVPNRKASSHTIVFGHWAALGLHISPGIVAIDTGCAWGKELTAYRLEDGHVASEPSIF